jgi:hypothetical protein
MAIRYKTTPILSAFMSILSPSIFADLKNEFNCNGHTHLLYYNLLKYKAHRGFIKIYYLKQLFCCRHRKNRLIACK